MLLALLLPRSVLVGIDFLAVDEDEEKEEDAEEEYRLVCEDDCCFPRVPL